ncbi:hypothetical protein J6590_020285 [Homalodisca vitripennis]|nr:hypothetical protein J6590_020285 [Homalodisca vitripennis]
MKEGWVGAYPLPLCGGAHALHPEANSVPRPNSDFHRSHTTSYLPFDMTVIVKRFSGDRAIVGGMFSSGISLVEMQYDRDLSVACSAREYLSWKCSMIGTWCITHHLLPTLRHDGHHEEVFWRPGNSRWHVQLGISLVEMQYDRDLSITHHLLPTDMTVIMKRFSGDRIVGGMFSSGISLVEMQYDRDLVITPSYLQHDGHHEEVFWRPGNSRWHVQLGNISRGNAGPGASHTTSYLPFDMTVIMKRFSGDRAIVGGMFSSGISLVEMQYDRDLVHHTTSYLPFDMTVIMKRFSGDRAIVGGMFSSGISLVEMQYDRDLVHHTPPLTYPST